MSAIREERRAEWYVCRGRRAVGYRTQVIMQCRRTVRGGCAQGRRGRVVVSKGEKRRRRVVCKWMR